MELRKKVERLLRQAFPKPDRVRVQDDKGVSGLVVSSRFKGLDSADRQQWLWQVVDQHLTPEERKNFVMIIAVTPEEEVAHTS